MPRPSRLAKVLAVLNKNKLITLFTLACAGLIGLAATKDAIANLWDTFKIKQEASEDAAEIASIKKQVEEHRDAIALIVRDANAARNKIAEAGALAKEAKAKGEGLAALFTETDTRVRAFQTFLDDLKTRYEKDQKELSAQLAELKARNMIAALGDKATSDRDRDAYNMLAFLTRVVTEDQLQSKLKRPGFVTLASGEMIPLENRVLVASSANAEIARVKQFWIGITGIKAWQLTRAEGTIIVKARSASQVTIDPPLTTKELLSGLAHADWYVRCLSAKELGSRKEVGVPDALLKRAIDDKNLEVSRDALESFEKVTGYRKFDVFGWADAKEWWSSHAEETNSKLTKPEEASPATAADAAPVS